MPGNFKETVFQKNEWGVIYLLKINSWIIKFFWISFKTKTALCVYAETAQKKRRNIYLKGEYLNK
jgi:hypothetical protein